MFFSRKYLASFTAMLLGVVKNTKSRSSFVNFLASANFINSSFESKLGKFSLNF